MTVQKNRPGLVGLAGGGEFTKGSEESDRYLLAHAALCAWHTGQQTARVVVVAIGDGDPQPGMTWFAKLAQSRPDPAHELGLAGDRSESSEALAGAKSITFETHALSLDKHDDTASTYRLIKNAALTYCTGDSAENARDILAGSAAWRACLAALEQGAVLVGAGAVASAFGAQMIGANRAAITGLGLVPCGVVPHHNTTRNARQQATMLLHALPNGYVLGVDERMTVTVRLSGGKIGTLWRGTGRSWTTLYTQNSPRKFNAGNAFKIT